PAASGSMEQLPAMAGGTRRTAEQLLADVRHRLGELNLPTADLAQDVRLGRTDGQRRILLAAVPHLFDVGVVVGLGLYRRIDVAPDRLGQRRVVRRTDPLFLARISGGISSQAIRDSVLGAGDSGRKARAP